MKLLIYSYSLFSWAICYPGSQNLSQVVLFTYQERRTILGHTQIFPVLSDDEGPSYGDLGSVKYSLQCHFFLSQLKSIVVVPVGGIQF